jgi:hypothetical protein
MHIRHEKGYGLKSWCAGTQKSVKTVTKRYNFLPKSVGVQPTTF